MKLYIKIIFKWMNNNIILNKIKMKNLMIRYKIF